MPRALLASFADRRSIPDLRWIPDARLSPALLRVEVLSGPTVALLPPLPFSRALILWWGFTRPSSWGR